MIGINVAVRAGAGIGFAIPVDSVLRIVTRLLSVEPHRSHMARPCMQNMWYGGSH